MAVQSSRGKTKTKPLGCEPCQHLVLKINEELLVSIHTIYIYIESINEREEKSVLDPSALVRKDAFSNYAVDGCPQCFHQSL